MEKNPGRNRVLQIQLGMRMDDGRTVAEPPEFSRDSLTRKATMASNINAGVALHLRRYSLNSNTL